MNLIKISLKLLILFTLITGVLYPVLVYGIAEIFFPEKSNGSFLFKNGIKTGSTLISQEFKSEAYFHPRPSAIFFNPVPSGASNYGPLSLRLKERTDSLKRAYILQNNLNDTQRIPNDAVFASGSGCDPHISTENAKLQFERVSAFRNFDKTKKEKLILLIDKLTEAPQFGILGEERINILVLNSELDKL